MSPNTRNRKTVKALNTFVYSQEVTKNEIQSPEEVPQKTDYKTENNYKSFLTIEDYNGEFDDKFVYETVFPYLSNLFEDLKIRSSAKETEKEPEYLDKVSFVEYT